MSVDRRTMLQWTGLAAAGAIAGCSSSGDTGDGGDDGGKSYDGWLSNAKNHDGVADETGASEVTVKVGADTQNNWSFGPAAVKVSTGTTVTWEWTGKGGMHNVLSQDGAPVTLDSELVGKEGHTYSKTFESTGVTKYYCQPHKGSGMKGVVEVVE